MYSVNFNWSKRDDAFIAVVPELPGCMADGETRQEAMAAVEVVIAEWIETAWRERFRSRITRCKHKQLDTTMRSRIFRALAGILSASFVWFLITVDQSGRSVRELVGFWAIGLTFGAFAIFGAEPAERLLCVVFGIPYPERQVTNRVVSEDKAVESKD